MKVRPEVQVITDSLLSKWPIQTTNAFGENNANPYKSFLMTVKWKASWYFLGYMPYGLFSSVSSWIFPNGIWNNSYPQYIEDIRLAPNKDL